MCKTRGCAICRAGARLSYEKTNVRTDSLAHAAGLVASSRIALPASRTGLGLFATKPIAKGDFIIKYWGPRLPNKIADEIDNRYLFEINKRWTIDGSPRRNIARYINHSCRPNAETDIIKGEILISAIKNIAAGRRDHLRLRQGPLQRLHQADWLPVRQVPGKAAQRAERGRNGCQAPQAVTNVTGGRSSSAQ